MQTVHTLAQKYLNFTILYYHTVSLCSIVYKSLKKLSIHAVLNIQTLSASLLTLWCTEMSATF